MHNNDELTAADLQGIDSALASVAAEWWAKHPANSSMSAPALFASEREWAQWVSTASNAQLETERVKAWKIRITRIGLRDQIQADCVIETIDWELGDRYEATA
jgi:hypothetical protein